MRLIGKYKFEKSVVSCIFEGYADARAVRRRSGATASWKCLLARKSSINDEFVKRWRDLFSDPSQWWDNRSGKPNPRFPDFKHKRTGVGLWVTDERNPSWVAFEIASIAPGLSSFSRAQRLSGYNRAGQYERTMELFAEMENEGVELDAYVYIHVLKACAAVQGLKEGIRIHRRIIETGCDLNLYLNSSLIDMYTKCGSIEDALKVFQKMPQRDVVAWNSMIMGYVKSGQGPKAIESFEQMQREGFKPDTVTYVGLLNACASMAALHEGRRIHEHIIRSGCQSDLYVGNSLIDMYGKCGSLEDARRVFDAMPTLDVVSWNSMIIGSVKCGAGESALELFQRLLLENVQPNCVTFVGLLNACASTLALEEGWRIHQRIIQSGCDSNVYVGSSLVDMYSKCGSMDDAWIVFNKMPKHNVVAWTAIIMGCVKCGHEQSALELYHRMQLEGVEPNSSTFVALLNACARLAALEQGKHVHQEIIRSGCESNLYVGISLVDMYAKCGSIYDARNAFNTLPNRQVGCWNAMIMGYAMHGDAREALALFEHMLGSGSKVDEVTFICLLSACSHGGLVKEGMHYFETMGSMYGVPTKQEHYTCMVDILARAGLLDEAEDMLRTLPLESIAAAWISLLGGCRTHGNLEMGQRALKQVLGLDPANVRENVLLSNIYAATCDWDSDVTVQYQD